MNRGGLPQLTDTEQERLHLLLVERLTPKEIANRQKVTPSAVYQTFRALKKKGFLTDEYRAAPGVKQTFTQEGMAVKAGADSAPRSPVRKSWDLHGCKWRVPILEGQNDRRYKDALGGGSAQVRVNNATVELHRNTIIVHGDELHFTAADPGKAVRNSWTWLWHTLGRLENDYRLILRKDRHPIRRYAGHFARMDDEMARAPGGDQIMVVAEDGKRRWWVDWSRGSVPELEAGHPKTAQQDAEAYARHVEDMADHPELRVSKITEFSSRNAQQLGSVAQQMSTLVQSVNTLAEGFSGLVSSQKALMDVMRAQMRPAHEENEPLSGRDSYFG